MASKRLKDIFIFILLSLIKRGCSDGTNIGKNSNGTDFFRRGNATEHYLHTGNTTEYFLQRECNLSEMRCDNGGCVSLDKYCDGSDDCGDKSDEPKSCTPCNRTYYGLIGRTYEFEVKRPREDQLPFICHLNFTATGGVYGDIVQLTFDTFTIGKFVSFTADGCPDGHMTIEERAPSAPRGQWCGSAWGYTVYFSENNSVNVTLQLDRLSQQGVGYNFEFKLAYKFLLRSEARLRYGNSSVNAWRGELVEGSYCDRILKDCDLRECRIQSPNFPGVYPRNASCTYRIEQTRTPPGKHALIAVRQTNSHKIHIKDQIVKYDRSQRVLKLWDQCNIVQDYLTVWDGGTRSAPKLARLCGGDSVPDIISRGPNMLLEFHTSPYDNPFHPVPLSYLPGFELEVQIIFLDKDSNSYVGEDGKCSFTISAFDSTSGEIRHPRHSLPPNTTCIYHFQGKASDIVWISFVKYFASGGQPAGFDQNKDCSTQLSIWDGSVPGTKGGQSTNGTLLGSFCRDESPRLCDHALLSNASRITRPCSPEESFITSGPTLTIVQDLQHGSAMHPVSFQLRYEFVDVSMQGQQPEQSKNICNRIFRSNETTSGKFRSPRSIFNYGRGGMQNLSCSLRFESFSGERVRLTFHELNFAKKCRSSADPRTGRWRCERNKWILRDGISDVTILEYPWNGVPLRRDCLCSNRSESLTIRTLTASVVEVIFTVTNMNITDDYKNFGFEGEYRFVSSGPGDDAVCSTAWGNRLISGTSGTILLRDNMEELPLPEVISDDNVISESVRAPHCTHRPWLLEPSGNTFMYIWLTGREISSAEFCPTSNRVFIYAVENITAPREICPDVKGSTVGIWSAGWNSSAPIVGDLGPHSRGLILEFLQRDPAAYVVHWLEVTKPVTFRDADNEIFLPLCAHKCPEINACISALLWCNGSPNCPSGFDESDGNCAFGFTSVSPTYAGAIAAGGAVLLASILAICARKCRNSRVRRDALKAREEAALKTQTQLPDRREFATVQKYASIDRYGLKYSAGVNDARYYDEYRRDKLDARYQGHRMVDDDGLC